MIVGPGPALGQPPGERTGAGDEASCRLGDGGACLPQRARQVQVGQQAPRVGNLAQPGRGVDVELGGPGRASEIAQLGTGCGPIACILRPAH